MQDVQYLSNQIIKSLWEYVVRKMTFHIHSFEESLWKENTN